MEEELVSCASKLLSPFLDPIVKEIHHTVQYRERIKGLKVEVLNLKKGRDKVESSVKEGEEKFGYLERKDNVRFNKVSKEAETAKMTDEALVQKKDEFKGLLQRRPLDMTRSLYDTSYKAFDSRKTVEQKIINALKAGDVNVIGVHGFAGVGKTSLVEKVASVAMEDKLFDTMVMVDVQSLNVETIQEDIAKKLGWQLTETDVNERAARLLDSLKRQTRRVLVNLRASCLLLDSGVDDKFVKMSHTMHSVAVSIAEDGGQVSVSIPEGANSREVLESTMSKEDLTRLSVINGDISELPERCSLTDIGIIGELKESMILKFSFCDFKVLPTEIGDLTKLKSLDLSDCPKFQQITPNVISRLTRLEELYMANSYKWRSNAILAELKELPHLNSLCHGICSTLKSWKDLYLDQLSGVEDVVEALNSEKEVEVTDCKNLKEIFGDEEIEESTDHADQKVVFPKLLRVVFFSKKEHEEMNLENETTAIHPFFDEKVHCPSLEKMILSRLDNIQLIWHNKLQADSFCKLKVLRVEFCGKLISFVPPDRLGRLSKNPQRLHTFQNLEIVRVTECWSMKNLFPVSIALGLRQLKELEINSCRLEEIVANEEVKVAAVFKFLQLDFLQLVDLPELKSFLPQVAHNRVAIAKKLSGLSLS
ncbi:hypothetical protein Patl1_11766 [Pistacia atlantica]|uniref:Uncharacterized protein n=1 Tax=Pistacia atlantica TaxID=434234 RepID=A0ACC1A7N3_9ROSI|nr:hypothetical protein Patl1_11766 [Pistacia atlantica]